MKIRHENGYSPKVKIFTMDKSIFNTYHKDLTILDIDYPIANPVKVVTLGEYEEEYHSTIITNALQTTNEMWEGLAEEYYGKENEDE
jgi:hypothetical protein